LVILIWYPEHPWAWLLIPVILAFESELARDLGFFLERTKTAIYSFFISGFFLPLICVI